MGNFEDWTELWLRPKKIAIVLASLWWPWIVCHQKQLFCAVLGGTVHIWIPRSSRHTGQVHVSTCLLVLGLEFLYHLDSPTGYHFEHTTWYVIFGILRMHGFYIILLPLEIIARRSRLMSCSWVFGCSDFFLFGLKRPSFWPRLVASFHVSVPFLGYQDDPWCTCTRLIQVDFLGFSVRKLTEDLWPTWSQRMWGGGGDKPENRQIQTPQGCRKSEAAKVWERHWPGMLKSMKKPGKSYLSWDSEIFLAQICWKKLEDSSEGSMI